MSKKKQGGKTSQHVSPDGKRLGVKVSDGEKVKIGSILVKQRGTRFMAGTNVKVGRDHTLFAISEGIAKYSQKLGKKMISIVKQK